jgi:hypothetical protein
MGDLREAPRLNDQSSRVSILGVGTSKDRCLDRSNPILVPNPYRYAKSRIFAEPDGLSQAPNLLFRIIYLSDFSLPFDHVSPILGPNISLSASAISRHCSSSSCCRTGGSCYDWVFYSLALHVASTAGRITSTHDWFREGGILRIYSGTTKSPSSNPHISPKSFQLLI